jgi:hypothetical protein
LKLINGLLYLEFSDAIQSGCWTEKYLWKAKSTGSKSIQFLKDPSDNRKVLIEFESLKDQYKDQVKKRFGNPYDHLAKEPIKKMVVKDDLAKDFYLKYRFDGNKMLPIEKVEEYTIAASWLNMLSKADENKREIKRLLNLNVADFFVKVIEIIESENIALPGSYVRLREKINQFKQQGYSLLIHKQYGNTNAKKISDVGEALLLELLAKPNHDDTIICYIFNQWAAKNGQEQITPATVGTYRRNNLNVLMAEKEGNAKWYNTFGKQIIRKRPSAPLLLVGSDDNELDLYFQEDGTNKKGYSIINYFNRFNLIVVMDAFNDYVLGYSYAKTVTADLVREAYLNAIHHVKELTGGFYLPHQLQTDRWGKGTLDEFYKSIAIYTPAVAKAPRGKYIERAFGTQWHQQLAFYNNYSGHNITAKQKLNTDLIEKNKKDFPYTSQASIQIEHFINTMRNLKGENGVTKKQQWIEAFNNSDKSKQRSIDDMQMLLLFGKKHDYKNTISNRGITPAINCVERTYEIPNEIYLDTVGRTAQVIFDQFDYSRILVDTGNLRFIAKEVELMPSAIADYKPGDGQRFHAKLLEKKNHVKAVSDAKDERLNILSDNGIDAEGLLRVGVLLPKNVKQSIEVKHQQKRLGGANYDPLDAM